MYSSSFNSDILVFVCLCLSPCIFHGICLFYLYYDFQDIFPMLPHSPLLPVASRVTGGFGPFLIQSGGESSCDKYQWPNNSTGGLRTNSHKKGEKWVWFWWSVRELCFFSKEWWKEDLPVCNFLQKQVHIESSKSVAAGDGGRQACEAGKKDGEPSPF